ncbi:hypothetical protein F0562_020354 [Nyssa sinensis]|uniref:NAC domain-containing protein n=1 Tax=Nyssa sinensis TaxID=561372 RepID=A0A5J5BU19_9ASTE|nr:hypothetical protein F0562_020354 [Nyssa sinensis]
MGDNNVNLPPGFRFCPTDEELVVHFLQRKPSLLCYDPDLIPDLDLYPYDPWELNGKAMAEGKKWYFFSRRTQNRITDNGYWKSLGDDEPVTSSAKKTIGWKKYYMFYYNGEPPAGGVKTNWIMQEYRLSDSGSSSRSSRRRGRSEIVSNIHTHTHTHTYIYISLYRTLMCFFPHIFQDYSNWVVCLVYERNYSDDDDGTDLSYMDEVFLSMDDMEEISFPY